MSTTRESSIFIGVILNNTDIQDIINSNPKKYIESNKILKENSEYYCLIAESLAEELCLSYEDVYEQDGELHIFGYKYEGSQKTNSFIKEIEEKSEKIKKIFNKEAIVISNINSY